MQLIRDLTTHISQANGAVITLGCFDGVHLGHQRLMQRVVTKAKAQQRNAWVITFEPYPVEVLSQQGVPYRLTRWREKYEIIQQVGITHMLCLRFNTILAEMSAEDFLKNILVKQCHLKHVIVGDDCRFGKNRQGDISMLKQFSQQLGYELEVISSLNTSVGRISSSRVRKALATGCLDQVEALLGRPYQLMGRVVHGEKLGRELGYPTANIPLRRSYQGISGIYIVSVQLDQHVYRGVANIGIRPTVGGTVPLLEVHLFDFHGELYGRLLRVQLLKKIRDEVKFDSVTIMQQQMQQDVKEAMAYTRGI